MGPQILWEEFKTRKRLDCLASLKGHKQMHKINLNIWNRQNG